MLHGQESAPWWRSIFSGTQQNVSPEKQPVETPPLLESTSPVEDAPSSTPDSAVAVDQQNPLRPAGSATFQWDPRIDDLESAWLNVTHPIKGFRIQIFSGSLQQAREVRSVIRKQAKGTPVYLSSLPPNYRVAIGDYRTKWEAQKDQDNWRNSYPNSIVVPMEINLPELEQPKD